MVTTIVKQEGPTYVLSWSRRPGWVGWKGVGQTWRVGYDHERDLSYPGM